MSSELDPTAYDVDELRRAARGLAAAPDTDDEAETDTRTRGTHSGPGRAAAAEALLVAAASGEVERPYLPTLPGGFAAEAEADEWCSFLLERAGFAHAHRALSHYHDRGWLGEYARDQLETRLVGLSDGHDPRPVGGSLSPEDHRTSLVYVARLATVDGGAGAMADGGSVGGGGGERGNRNQTDTTHEDKR